MEGEGNLQCNGEHCFTFIIYSTLVNVRFGHGSYFTDGNLYPFLIKKNTENDDSGKKAKKVRVTYCLVSFC